MVEYEREGMVLGVNFFMGWFENAIKFPVVFLALVTALLSGTGLIIINGHLGTYFISDYTIISAKSIYTGIMFFLFLAVSVTIIYSSIDVYNMNKIDSKDWFNFITKPILCTNVLASYFLYPGYDIDLFPIYSIFGLYDISSYWIYTPIMISIAPLFLVLQTSFINRESNEYKNNMKFYKIILIFTISTFPIMMYNNKEYRSILYMFVILSAICYQTYLFLCKRKKYMEEMEKNNNDLPGSSDSVVKTVIPLSNITIISTAIVMVLMFVNNYSKTIYPAIDEQYGGGKLILIQVTTNDGEVIKGPLLHYDDKRYYLLGSNKLETQIIEISKIKTIQRQ